MNLRAAAGLGGLILASACTMENPPPATPPPGAPAAGEQCIAAQYRSLIGQTRPTISVPAGTVSRSYKRGDPVTMDLNPLRVNFEYDEAGALLAVTCG